MARSAGSGVVTVNDVLDGHVALDLECLDRVYLSGFVNSLQTPGGVVYFLHTHRGQPIASPAVFGQIGDRFRAAVGSYAEANHIPVVKLKALDRNAEVMRPYLAAAARSGRSQVAAIGVAQEPQPVWTARQRDTDPAKPPQFSFTKENRRVTVYYFYLWDADFGPAFIKICSYFPYPIKIWVNGHEWAKRQATRAGIGFTELSNGFASTEDPAGLQAICDRLGPGVITVFFERWMARLPVPLTRQDRDAGFWWELSMRQIEVSRTIVFDAPRHTRAFFEALIADNLDIAPPRTRRDRLRARSWTQGRWGVQNRDRPAHPRGHPEHLLQALPDQAVPQRSAGTPHRDRRQRRLRPRQPAPAPQPRRPPHQSTRLQPPIAGC